MKDLLITDPNQVMLIGSLIFDHFEHDTKPLRVSIKNGSKRSLNQNSTLWMWLGELSVQIKVKSGESYSTDDLHEYFKQRFCPDQEITLGDKTIYVKSTKRLTTGEMHFYMNQIHEWAVNAGFKLTIPIESEYREVMERQNG